MQLEHSESGLKLRLVLYKNSEPGLKLRLVLYKNNQSNLIQCLEASQLFKHSVSMDLNT